MTTLTLVPKRSVATEHSRTAPLLAWFVERIVRLRWPGEMRLEPTVARAIDEAFEGLAREARS